MPFCMECGVKIPQDAFFCPSCGTKQIIFSIEDKAELISEKPDVQSVVTDNTSVAPTIEEPAPDTSEVIIPPVKNDKVDGDAVEVALSAPIQEAAPTKFADTAQQAEPLQKEISATVQDMNAAQEQITTEQKTPEASYTADKQIHSVFDDNKSSVLPSTINNPNAAQQTVNQSQADGFTEPLTVFREKDFSYVFDKEDIKKNRILAAYCYIPPFFFVPLIFKPQSRFCLFHANQSLLLTITMVIWSVINAILTSVFSNTMTVTSSWGYTHISTAGSACVILVWTLQAIAFLTWFYLGLIDTMNCRAKKLPLIGRINLIFK